MKEMARIAIKQQLILTTQASIKKT